MSLIDWSSNFILNTVVECFVLLFLKNVCVYVWVLEKLIFLNKTSQFFSYIFAFKKFLKDVLKKKKYIVFSGTETKIIFFFFIFLKSVSNIVTMNEHIQSTLKIIYFVVQQQKKKKWGKMEKKGKDKLKVSTVQQCSVLWKFCYCWITKKKKKFFLYYFIFIFIQTRMSGSGSFVCTQNHHNMLSKFWLIFFFIFMKSENM